MIFGYWRWGVFTIVLVGALFLKQKAWGQGFVKYECTPVEGTQSSPVVNHISLFQPVRGRTVLVKLLMGPAITEAGHRFDNPTLLKGGLMTAQEQKEMRNWVGQASQQLDSAALADRASLLKDLYDAGGDNSLYLLASSHPIQFVMSRGTFADFRAALPMQLASGVPESFVAPVFFTYYAKKNFIPDDPTGISEIPEPQEGGPHIALIRMDYPLIDKGALKLAASQRFDFLINCQSHSVSSQEFHWVENGADYFHVHTSSSHHGSGLHRLHRELLASFLKKIERDKAQVVGIGTVLSLTLLRYFVTAASRQPGLGTYVVPLNEPALEACHRFEPEVLAEAAGSQPIFEKLIVEEPSLRDCLEQLEKYTEAQFRQWCQQDQCL